jgi:hypothetical protein
MGKKKRGQTGDTLTWFSAIVVIMIILIIFVVFSSFMGKAKLFPSGKNQIFIDEFNSEKLSHQHELFLFLNNDFGGYSGEELLKMFYRGDSELSEDEIDEKISKYFSDRYLCYFFQFRDDFTRLGIDINRDDLNLIYYDKSFYYSSYILVNGEKLNIKFWSRKC